MENAMKYVYLILSADGHAKKIGMSGNPELRLRRLDVGPFELTFAHSAKCEWSRNFEKWLHRAFRHCRWAMTNGFSPSFISLVVNGKSKLTPKLAAALGFERVLVWKSNGRPL